MKCHEWKIFKHCKTQTFLFDTLYRIISPSVDIYYFLLIWQQSKFWTWYFVNALGLWCHLYFSWVEKVHKYTVCRTLRNFLTKSWNPSSSSYLLTNKINNVIDPTIFIKVFTYKQHSNLCENQPEIVRKLEV